MGRWSRSEIEEAFVEYQKRAAASGASGDWRPWAELFTEDASYREHLFGEFSGREAIHEWISKTMTDYPGREMPEFPIEWYVIDAEKGWVICQVWNRMRDPGDGSLHQEANITILHYAGDGRWSYEEDVYNPYRFGTMLAAWEAARDAAATN